MGSSIFISYRRVDSSDVTGRIYDRLVTAFDRASVFKDVDSIPVGVDFRDYLDRAVGQCQICVVVIGPKWLEADESGQRRIDSSQDFVRLEIESTLRRNIPVIPVLVSGARIPAPEQLPFSLQPLAFRNGAQVRSDPDFHRDMDRLIAGIRQHFGTDPLPTPVPAPVPPAPKPNLFTFEVVTVNDRGQEISRKPGQAEYAREDLGNGVVLDLVKILGGTFEMGANECKDEQPIHAVTVAPFGLGKFPVTQEQYEAVMGTNPSRFKGAKRPVECVTWQDAVQFCQRLSEKTGNLYRLPSEAEWEYACRAGTKTPFHFGETITTELANYRGTDLEVQGTTSPGNYGKGPKGQFREQTTPVGKFLPNAFGLYDMHGNVWEWCQDIRHDSYKGAPPDGTAWEDGNAYLRIRRGGSWAGDPRFCRSACRYGSLPVIRDDDDGFRVACAALRTL